MLTTYVKQWLASSKRETAKMGPVVHEVEEKVNMSGIAMYGILHYSQ